MNLHSWLRRSPQPVAILADETRVLVSDSPRKWADLEETLESLGASRLVALDEKGATLRAVTLDVDPDQAPAATSSSGKASPLTTDLQALSKLLAEAYRTGAETSMNALRFSMEENTKLVRLLADRLGAIEVAWQRSLSSHAKLMTDLAEARAAASNGGGGDELMGLLAAAAGMGPAAAATPPAPANGAKPR